MVVVLAFVLTLIVQLATPFTGMVAEDGVKEHEIPMRLGSSPAGPIETPSPLPFTRRHLKLLALSVTGGFGAPANVTVVLPTFPGITLTALALLTTFTMNVVEC